jgi:choline dehydrogenase-like flavoprotein
MSVVDSELRVHLIDGLWVIDASVMSAVISPTHPLSDRRKEGRETLAA